MTDILDKIRDIERKELTKFAQDHERRDNLTDTSVAEFLLSLFNKVDRGTLDQVSGMAYDKIIAKYF